MHNTLRFRQDFPSDEYSWWRGIFLTHVRFAMGHLERKFVVRVGGERCTDNNFKSILNERSKDKGIDEDEGNPFHKENNVRETLEFFWSLIFESSFTYYFIDTDTVSTDTLYVHALCPFIFWFPFIFLSSFILCSFRWLGLH